MYLTAKEIDGRTIAFALNPTLYTDAFPTTPFRRLITKEA